MSGADMPDRTPMTLFTYNTKFDVAQNATGCDADVGGTSTVHFELDESTATEDKSKDPLAPLRPTARFWGNMNLGVRSEFQGKVRGGYAGFRNKVRDRLVRTSGRETDEARTAAADAFRRGTRGRLKPHVFSSAPSSQGPCPHPQLLLRQYPDGRTCYNGSLATQALFPPRRPEMGRYICTSCYDALFHTTQVSLHLDPVR